MEKTKQIYRYLWLFILFEVLLFVTYSFVILYVQEDLSICNSILVQFNNKVELQLNFLFRKQSLHKNLKLCEILQKELTKKLKL